MTFEVLLDQAMRLPPTQRGDLATRLLESLRESDDVDQETWEQEWAHQIRQRLDHDDGQRASLSDTLAELRSRLAPRR